MIRNARWIAASVLLCAAPALAGVEVVLQDGRRLAGEALERKGQVYLLDVGKDSQTLAIPIGLVSEIRFFGGVSPNEEEQEAAPDEAPLTVDDSVAGTTEVREARRQAVATGSEAGTEADSLTDDASPTDDFTPTDDGAPATDAGLTERAPRRPPRLDQQLAAFDRDQASFARSTVSPFWRYDDVLGEGTDVTQFNASRWYRPGYEPFWEAESAYDYTSRIPDFNPSGWYRPAVNTRWYPKDGWDETE